MFERIPVKALSHYCLNIHPIFKDKISEGDFIQTFETSQEERTNKFYRACLSYAQSQKCKICDPENTMSLALSLLCTSIETASSDSTKYSYHDWLVKYKLDAFVNKSKTEIKKEFQESFQEYLKHPQRTGKRRDFTIFLLEHCPQDLKTPPIRRKQIINGVEHALWPCSFEESVNYIYSRFRSPYVHKSITKIDIPKEYANFNGLGLLDYYNKKYYHTNVKELLNWLSNVTKESLYNYFFENFS